jgi:hypothetical protein
MTTESGGVEIVGGAEGVRACEGRQRRPEGVRSRHTVGGVDGVLLQNHTLQDLTVRTAKSLCLTASAAVEGVF